MLQGFVIDEGMQESSLDDAAVECTGMRGGRGFMKGFQQAGALLNLKLLILAFVPSCGPAAPSQQEVVPRVPI